jgi:ribosomal protein S12 methylthiotransferase
MARRQTLSRRRMRAQIGKQMRVLIDEVHLEVIIGRSSADAPEIDGKVFINSGHKVHPGDFVEVLIKTVSAVSVVSVGVQNSCLIPYF